MEHLRLVSRTEDNSQETVAQRELTVGVADFAHGCGVGWPAVESRLFSSVHIFEDNVELWETIVSKPRLTRENPFLNDQQLRNLDEHGLVREGTRVKVQDVLASIVEADIALRTRRSPAKGMQWVQDGSWRVPSGWNRQLSSRSNASRDANWDDTRREGSWKESQLSCERNGHWKSATCC